MNKDFTTPDLCDEYGIDVEVSLGTYESYGAVHKFYGKVETVLCPDDNSMVKEILANISLTIELSSGQRTVSTLP